MISGIQKKYTALLSTLLLITSALPVQASANFKEFANSDMGKELGSKLQQKISNASDEQTGKKLLKAATFGDADIVAQLISKGADVEVRDDKGFTPLILAAANGRTEVVRLLINAKANVDRSDGAQNTPLYYATVRNYPEIASMLIYAGANVNCKSNSGDTPLIQAVKTNNFDIAKLLINNNANPDIKNNINNDAFYYVFKNNEKMQDLLFSKSRKTDIRNYNGETPLIQAAWENDYQKVMNILNMGANVNATDSKGLSALYWSFRYDNYRIFDLLIQHGADLKKIKRPLFLATSNGLTARILYKLLSNGEDITQTDEHLNTVLMEASNAKFPDITAYLLEHGADKIINERNDEGRTALSLAVSRMKPAVVKILLEKGADPNIANNDNGTPLMFSPSAEITKMLLDKGADPNVQTFLGYTALLLTEDPEIIKLLIAAGADVNVVNPISGSTSLSHVLISHKNEAATVAAVKMLVEAGANPNVFNKGGCGLAPLFWAIYYNHPEAVKLLLKAGGNPNLLNIKNKNITPLMACSTTTMADILIKAGADINAVDNNGKSVLDYASEQQDLGLFRFLEVKGADVDRPYEDGETKLIKALKKGDLLEVQTLIRRNADPFAGKDSKPFVTALKSNNPEIVSIMLENVKDINSAKVEGFTPLTMAVQLQNKSATQQILARKADVNKTDGNGNTALSLALNNKNREIAETLIKSGADVNIPRSDGVSPLFQAAANNDIDMMKTILSAGAYANDPNAVYATVKNNNPAALQLLLDAGADPTIKNNENKGFMDFAKENKANDVKKLLKSAIKKYKEKSAQ